MHERTARTAWCYFPGVTKSGRVRRKRPDNEAWSLFRLLPLTKHVVSPVQSVPLSVVLSLSPDLACSWVQTKFYPAEAPLA